MYLYFFDIDDTIANSKEVIDYIIAKHLDNKEHNMNDQEVYDFIGDHLAEYGFDNLCLKPSKVLNLLNQLLCHDHEKIYYITARRSFFKQQTINWLKKHNLFTYESRLLLDQEHIKGQTINQILNKSKEQFAFLFDDDIRNHDDCKAYPNIITCYP